MKTTRGGRWNWGGAVGGWWDAVTSVMGRRRRRCGRGGSAPDDGARVVGISHLPQRSTPVGDRGRLSSTDRRQEGSKGANFLGHIMVQPTHQPTMRHWVQKPEAKKKPVDRASYLVGRTDERYNKKVLSIDACGQALNSVSYDILLMSYFVSCPRAVKNR